METEEYKRHLLAKKQELLEGLGTDGTDARELDTDSAGDVADESVDDDIKSDQFTEANSQWKLLKEVRAALKRIEQGTFGKCIVDGGPIGEKRLKAIPWTPYCLKHQQQIESADPTPTPTL